MNWMMKMSVGLFLVIGGAACSVQPRVDTGALPPGGTGTGAIGSSGGLVNPIAPGAPGFTAYGGAGCFDTRQIVENQGRFLEILTSRGRLFEFDNGAMVQVQVGGYSPYSPYSPYAPPPSPYAVPGAMDLTAIPLYAQGPCAGMAPGMCIFDTHAFARLPGNRLLEYVTTMNRQWVFENNQITGAGLDLSTIPRYTEICANRAMTGGLCIFDTRTFVKIGNDLVESITAYGRRWQYNIDGARIADSGADLMALPQYANGPCRGSLPLQCVLETRTFEPANGQLIEVITKGGFVFRYLPTGAEVQPSSVPVNTTPHWGNGPCR